MGQVAPTTTIAPAPEATIGPAHRPVLCAEVVAALAPGPAATILDGTFGAGGYSRALLEVGCGRVIALDRDPAATAPAAALAARMAGRFQFVPGRFGELDRHLAAIGVARVDGVALDLGVSSMQLDQPERGFSFRHDGPLDMRMAGAAEAGVRAADVVAERTEAELAALFAELGEERHARRAARAVVAARAEAPITSTGRLASVLRAALGRSTDGIDPATRCFQALRLEVNDELGELARGLAAAERVLTPGGRLAVVSFHSLEDRLVKQFLAERALPPAQPSRHSPFGPASAAFVPRFRLVTRKPVTPGAAERADNPRARSAKLRVAERTDAPAGSGLEVLP